MGTVTLSDNNFYSDSEQVIATFTFSASYATGGEAITAATLSAITGSVKHLIANPAAGYVFEWDQANGKLKAYYADYSVSSDGVLIEVPAATDLSLVASRIVAYVSAN